VAPHPSAHRAARERLYRNHRIYARQRVQGKRILRLDREARAA
jgi:hypothetical protein